MSDDEGITPAFSSLNGTTEAFLAGTKQHSKQNEQRTQHICRQLCSVTSLRFANAQCLTLFFPSSSFLPCFQKVSFCTTCHLREGELKAKAYGKAQITKGRGGKPDTVKRGWVVLGGAKPVRVGAVAVID